MKNTILSIIAACGLCFSTFAQDNNESLFNAKELGVSLSSAYVVDTAAAFQRDYSFNITAGLSYFPTRNFGVEVNVPFYQTAGPSVSEVQAGFLARLPLGHIAPYIGLGGVYNWNSDSEFAYIGKAGLELRFNKKWGIFGEGQYRNNNFVWERGSLAVVGGVKVVF